MWETAHKTQKDDFEKYSCRCFLQGASSPSQSPDSCSPGVYQLTVTCVTRHPIHSCMHATCTSSPTGLHLKGGKGVHPPPPFAGFCPSLKFITWYATWIVGSQRFSVLNFCPSPPPPNKISKQSPAQMHTLTHALTIYAHSHTCTHSHAHSHSLVPRLLPCRKMRRSLSTRLHSHHAHPYMHTSHLHILTCAPQSHTCTSSHAHPHTCTPSHRHNSEAPSPQACGNRGRDGDVHLHPRLPPRLPHPHDEQRPSDHQPTAEGQ